MSLALARIPEPARWERVQHCVNLLAAGTLDPGAIRVARRGGRLVGAQVCVPLSGKTCLFWIPTAPGPIADQLVQAALDGCRRLGCKVAQALASADEIDQAGPLLRCGFRITTRMHQLGHDLLNLDEAPPSALRFEPFREANRPLFTATLERTYDGTLDCPELNGIRTMDEILDGHRYQGKFDPDFWWLVFDGADAVGVVMLVELADGLTWELAYLGVAAPFRRRQLGRAMMLHAMQALRSQPAARLTLAVDTRNEPARRLYQSLGFVEIESNDVLLLFFR